MLIVFRLLRYAVTATVELDDKFGIRAKEIYDICPDRVLATKLHAIKLPPTQQAP
jgi:hypothetical protein